MGLEVCVILQPHPTVQSGGVAKAGHRGPLSCREETFSPCHQGFRSHTKLTLKPRGGLPMKTTPLLLLVELLKATDLESKDL